MPDSAGKALMPLPAPASRVLRIVTSDNRPLIFACQARGIGRRRVSEASLFTKP
jgi:hypothetical protein